MAILFGVHTLAETSFSKKGMFQQVLQFNLIPDTINKMLQILLLLRKKSLDSLLKQRTVISHVTSEDAITNAPRPFSRRSTITRTLIATFRYTSRRILSAGGKVVSVGGCMDQDASTLWITKATM